MSTFQYSTAGLALTKRFEGLELHAYTDPGGVLTIGYGHTGKDVFHGQVITEWEAEVLLKSDLMASVVCVNHAVTAAISQYKFDALVDFAFNAGRASFLRSTLLTKVNARDFTGAVGEFGKWVNVDSRPLPGLVRGRAAEGELFRGVAV